MRLIIFMLYKKWAEVKLILSYLKKKKKFTCVIDNSSVLKEKEISFWMGVSSRKANQLKIDTFHKMAV